MADATTALWFEIEACLQPMLGAGGVAALYRRSLSQASDSHPCLRLDGHDALAGIDLPLLHAHLSPCPAATSLAAAQAWFTAFQRLLASLVGPALTATLLRPVWGTPPGHPPAQDNSP